MKHLKFFQLFAVALLGGFFSLLASKGFDNFFNEKEKNKNEKNRRKEENPSY